MSEATWDLRAHAAKVRAYCKAPDTVAYARAERALLTHTRTGQ